MRRASKICVAVAILAILAVTTITAQAKTKAPGKNQVLLVGRCTIGSTLDDAFYARYFSYDKNPPPKHQISQIKKIPISKTETYDEPIGTLGDLYYMLMDVPSDGVIRLPGLKLYLFGNERASLFLPMPVSIKVPEGSKYLYLGTFTYAFADEYFMIKDISRSDEFDEASVAVKKLYGEKTELSRAVLMQNRD